MPVRLTPKSMLLISYDRKSGEWVTREGVSFFLLSQYVDIEPGVTVENIFQLIDRDKDVKRFLSEYCSCDIDEIRNRAPVESNDDYLRVITELDWDDNGRPIPKETASVDTVVIVPFFYAFTDENTGERRLKGSYVLHGKSSKYDLCSTSLRGPYGIAYRQIKDFAVKLDCVMGIAECDEDKRTDDDTMAFSASVQYTLLDVLTTIVGHFGKSAFDPRYQKEIDEEREVLERLKRKQDDGDDNETEY